MRLSSIAVTLAAFLLAALASAVAARAVAALVEDRSVGAVRSELLTRGQDWVEVLGDGLQIVLEGQAPSEALRFRAMSIAGTVIDASRLIDNMTVIEAENLRPPAFAIEILRNDEGISIIGLIPAETDREALSQRLAEIAGDLPVADFLETADQPVPEGWRRSVDFALRTLAALPRSKISVAPGSVSVTAIADTIAEQRRLESDLTRSTPAGVRLSLTVNAPRPVITPFTLRLILGPEGARLDACAADTEAAQTRIVAALAAAGVEGRITCPLGLGAPSRDWAEAAESGISALAALGAGTLTISDVDVSLLAAEGTDPAVFDQVAVGLAETLPQGFALDATLAEAADRSAGPVVFTATRSAEGLVQIRGRLPDDVIALTVENLARARFGSSEVRMGTRITDGLPPGWSVRALAGIEALGRLSSGTVTVTPDQITLRGETGNADASAEITRLMIEKLGQDTALTIDVTYVEALDPIAGLPTAEECISRILFLTRERKITFDPGSTSLSAAAAPLLDDIAEVLRLCPDLPLEVAGYTDSQGSEQGNLRISQQRADAVLAALRARRVPVSAFVAMGYGEEDPIADNATEEGREANRRIEFRLIRVPGSEAEATGETGEAEAEGTPDEAAEEAPAD